MGRFERRAGGVAGRWLSELPDPFTLDDVLSVAGRDELDAALTWLYAAITRGRVEPCEGGGSVLHYRFLGDRRESDELQGAL